MTQDPGLASWLQLTLTPGLGAASLRAMLKQFGLPQAILQRKRSELAPFASAQALAALDSSAVREAVTRSLEWALAPGCRNGGGSPHPLDAVSLPPGDAQRMARAAVACAKDELRACGRPLGSLVLRLGEAGA